MTGLETIIHEIGESASAEAEEIIKNAEAEAKAIREEAIAETERQCSEMLVQAKKTATMILQRSESAAVLQSRQEKLMLRQQLISETLEQAALALEKLPDNAYRDFFAALAAKTGLSGNGIVWVNAMDSKRLGQEFLNQFPPSLSVSYAPEHANIQGGFIVTSGHVTVDCSIGAIFDSLRNELSDLTNRALFVEQL